LTAYRYDDDDDGNDDDGNNNSDDGGYNDYECDDDYLVLQLPTYLPTYLAACTETTIYITFMHEW
jgi:hypothetical protein